jgi:uncharacterized protein (DUF433 family)
MNTQLDMLTPTEAAVIAGVSLRDVHRVIDEQILPDSFYETTGTRSFTGQACVFISFYFQSADRLTSEARQKIIAVASQPSFDWKAARNLVHDEFLTIDFGPFRQRVYERFQRLRSARAMVHSDREILSGTPVIKGTRIPVYDVAACLANGNSMDDILSAYPRLTHDKVELAALYAEAVPQRGRPRQRLALPPGAILISSYTKSLAKRA